MVIDRPDGRVVVEEVGDGRRRVTVELPGGAQSVETRYSPALIEATLALGAPASLCYLLDRHEHAVDVRRLLETVVPAFLDARALAGGCVLDLLTGSGAWAVVLAELLPDATIAAVDPHAAELAAARLRVVEHGLAGRVQVLEQPSATTLPRDVGTFQAVTVVRALTLIAPQERARLLQEAWRRLEPGGRLVVVQASHRWFPVELHVTGLPLLNYLPAGLALAAARRFSSAASPTTTWQGLLQAGVRGTTAGEVARALRAAGDGKPVPVRPALPGGRGAADVWHAYSVQGRASRAKDVVRLGCRAVEELTRRPFAPDLSLAFEKR
ncbi:MAG: class I SAM-dependent methyltransferase [Thermoleophilia bacterium]